MFGHTAHVADLLYSFDAFRSAGLDAEVVASPMGGDRDRYIAVS